jgi:hypothetical protein
MQIIETDQPFASTKKVRFCGRYHHCRRAVNAISVFMELIKVQNTNRPFYLIVDKGTLD